MQKLCFLIVIILFSLNVSAGDYPKTRDEAKAEEIGSVLGEGIVFHPTKVKNMATKTHDSKINQYLWQAIQDVVDFAPIVSQDENLGKISTDWYSNKENNDTSSKLTISIVGDVISPESLHIELKQRVRKDGVWQESLQTNDSFRASIEDKILRRARQLYIRKTQN